MESGYPVNAQHAKLERRERRSAHQLRLKAVEMLRSAHQLRLKAVEMLRSSTQLVKSHGDDLGLEYLYNGMNTRFFGKQFASNGEKP